MFAIQLLARVVDDGFLGTGDGKERLPLGSSMKGDMCKCVCAVYVCMYMYVPQLIIVYMPRAGAILAGTSSFPTVRFEFLEVGEILFSIFDFGAKCVQHS